MKVLRRMARIVADERGISTPEALVIGGLAALMGYFAWNGMRTPVNTASSTLGNKVQNAVGSSNPTW